ncbi:hypothetical protein CC2G_012550 [Coprinopsis cinerea AmutBmut pab1-1]|nr:hypothetical protein CC2G_012550 [Coprinopsis cinerea AmutBmut pab1-1]
MENSIIGTSGESECTDIDGHESSCGSTQGEDELEGALSRVNELLDEATKEMDDGVLANVIVVLRKSSPEEECDEARAKVEVALIKALVTRFARHGLVEDLDEGVELLLRETLTPFAFTDQSPISGSEDEDCTDKVSSALDSLRKYRRSIDMSKVETAIVVAKQALSSYRDATNVRGELLLRTGNALVLKYLASDDERHLGLAASSFQDARRLFRSGDHDPMLFITLLNLQHIACIKFIEHERQELVELKRLREEMEAEDEQGRSAHMMGSQLMEDGNLHVEEAILWFQHSLSFRPPRHPRRLRTLDHYAIALVNRFGSMSDSRDLEEAVTLQREVLSSRSPGHPDRLGSLNNLASSLSTRFHHEGDLRDLEECITLDREALALCPPGHPDHSGSLNNLATSLLTVFLHKGDVRDLEECVALNREALALRPPGHPDRHRTLNDLATSVLTRFQHKGDFRDLEECITLNREALGLRSPGHPDRPRSLNILAFSLVTRFRYEGHFCDLEEGITLEREALVLRPPGHSDRASYLHNLATSLLTLFQHKGDFHDLEDSVSLHREALSLRPPGHPERPRSLNDFAITLSACFEHKGDFCDLEACIEALREARLLYSELDTSLGAEPNSRDTLADHPYWLSVTGNLVNNLKIKYRATGDDDVLDEIFQLLRSGSQSHGTLPLRRLDHARLWSSTCREFDRLEMALEAYGYGVATLPHLASLDLTLEQRQNALVWAKDLSRDAVRCAIEQGQLETAVVFLSTARSVFWSQAFQFRGPLDRLDALHPDLASELRSVTRQLEVATHETPQSGSASVQGLSQRPYLLAQKREAVISQIRAIDGFHDFLLPPSFDTLRTAARDNPIVFLNASKYGCDALILKQDGALHCHSLSTDLEQIAGFADAIHQLSRGQTVGTQLQRKIDDFCQSRNTRLQLRRRTQRTAEDDFKQLLEILWDVVTEPVIRILGLQKTDEPQRVWWCPTGPFAFLPIHAAGIYSDNAEASDCLSDYVVSSYCSSPQDLIAPPPTPNDEYEVLVVVEPGESGPSIHSLPFTLEELKMIQGLVPHERHLVTRVGSAETPSDPDAILGHINTASIVHLGCHGSQDDSNPLDSSLILSGGRLSMGSLIRGCRTSKAALAYLSACETAMGDKERPDESLSLAGTMQFAGFRSVVATMWSIHDEDAPVVADAFYRHLFRRGTAAPPDITDAACGLHLAVKKLRDLGRPFYRWVPFVHHGI